MINSTVTRRGQTTLPLPVRRALKLQAGHKLIYELHGDVVTLKTHPGIDASFAALSGQQVRNDDADFAEARAAAWRDRAARIEQKGR